MLRNIAIASLGVTLLPSIASCNRAMKNRPARTVTVSMLNGLSASPIRHSLENQSLRVVENHGDVYVTIMPGAHPGTYAAAFTCGSQNETLTDADSADIAFDIAMRCKVLQ